MPAFMSRSIYNNDKSQKNRSYIHIFFDEDIARLLVNPCYGYSRLLQATVDNCRSIYTARIYMQICRHADGKKWAIPYPDLRLLLNVDSPKKKGSTESKQRIRANSVPRYHEFRRRVLDVARDELLLMVQNNTTNYYFTYAEEFPSNRHSTPSHIIFNIYETHPSKKDLDAYENHLSQIMYIGTGIRPWTHGEAFTPALDYPAPIESAQLLKIQLYPTFRAYEIIGADDPGCGQWAPIERTINSPSISGHEFAPINTTHADAQGISCTLTSVSNMTRLDTKNPLLAPYTEGDTMLLLPFTESAAIAAKMMDRTFIKYKFYAKTQPNKVKISSFYNKPNLQIESTFSKSIITLTKRHPDRSAEDL